MSAALSVYWFSCSAAAGQQHLNLEPPLARTAPKSAPRCPALAFDFGPAEPFRVRQRQPQPQRSLLLLAELDQSGCPLGPSVAAPPPARASKSESSNNFIIPRPRSHLNRVQCCILTTLSLLFSGSFRAASIRILQLQALAVSSQRSILSPPFPPNSSGIPATAAKESTLAARSNPRALSLI